MSLQLYEHCTNCHCHEVSWIFSIEFSKMFNNKPSEYYKTITSMKVFPQSHMDLTSMKVFSPKSYGSPRTTCSSPFSLSWGKMCLLWLKFFSYLTWKGLSDAFLEQLGKPAFLFLGLKHSYSFYLEDAFSTNCFFYFHAIFHNFCFKKLIALN